MSPPPPPLIVSLPWPPAMMSDDDDPVITSSPGVPAAEISIVRICALLQIVPSANLICSTPWPNQSLTLSFSRMEPPSPAPGALSAMMTRTSLPLRATRIDIGIVSASTIECIVAQATTQHVVHVKARDGVVAGGRGLSQQHQPQ